MKSAADGRKRNKHKDGQVINSAFFVFINNILTGDEVLDFEADEAPIFLALDWRNKPNQPDHCVVTPRSSMLCETLEDCDDSSEDRRSQRGVTLEHCLQQFMKPEVLSREEAWYCPK